LFDIYQLKTDQEASMMVTLTANTIPAGELLPGQKGKILKINGRGEKFKRIADMGLTPGTIIEIEKEAPLGDPLEIIVKGYHLSLRKEDINHIFVELL